ncbi:MAG: flavodoxin domain-containing protein [Dehalococcoidia bacterium]|nr:flavodoxin domain-containing protein [Dehalococcoidia bacterium]
MKALIIYFSATGNTEKVAHSIRTGLEKENAEVTMLNVKNAVNEELYDYDIVFLGTPVINRLPSQTIVNYIEGKMKLHGKRGDVKLCAPKIQGKTAVAFCTYAGPHTGANEAVPSSKYIGQFFEHIGFDVAAEWNIVGALHNSNSEEINTRGKLGDIRERPNARDLATVTEDTIRLVRTLNRA